MALCPSVQNAWNIATAPNTIIKTEENITYFFGPEVVIVASSEERTINETISLTLETIKLKPLIAIAASSRFSLLLYENKNLNWIQQINYSSSRIPYNNSHNKWKWLYHYSTLRAGISISYRPRVIITMYIQCAYSAYSP